MANRKTHLRHQARRTSQGDSSPVSVVTEKTVSSQKPVAMVKEKPAASRKAALTEPKVFTQLSTAETDLVTLELRHRLMTVLLLLVLFGLIWILFHFTGVDEKIYSLFKITS